MCRFGESRCRRLPNEVEELWHHDLRDHAATHARWPRQERTSFTGRPWVLSNQGPNDGGRKPASPDSKKLWRRCTQCRTSKIREHKRPANPLEGSAAQLLLRRPGRPTAAISRPPAPGATPAPVLRRSDAVGRLDRAQHGRPTRHRETRRPRHPKRPHLPTPRMARTIRSSQPNHNT